jgi:hypothetical protein
MVYPKQIVAQPHVLPSLNYASFIYISVPRPRVINDFEI